MVNLGDYIGQIMSELTIARVNSDLEAARVAELYSQHELLKFFPIPKIRINDFEVDIPFLIIDAKDGAEEKETIDDIGKEFERISKEVIDKKGLRLSEESRIKFRNLVDEKVKEIKLSPSHRFDLPSIAKKMSPLLHKCLIDDGLEEKSISDVVNNIEVRTKDSIMDKLSEKPRLRIAVTSAELKEADSASVVRLLLKATEEGVEWTQISSSDESQETTRRLIPE